MIRRYETKPCQIEAIQLIPKSEVIIEIMNWVGSDLDISDPIKAAIVAQGVILDGGLVIHTLEGDMKASFNDFIIKGLRGEFYPCKPDVFNKKYQEI